MLLMIVNAGLPLLNLHQAGAVLPRALKYQDLRQKHQSAISEARMRSRLGISISVGTLDLIECGPAPEAGQSPHDHIPLYFIAAPSMAARRPSAERFSEGRD
jgi:hypothetical protein